MKLLIGQLSKEELSKLRTVWARHLGSVGQVLDDRTELPREIAVQVLYKCLPVHVILLRVFGFVVLPVMSGQLNFAGSSITHAPPIRVQVDPGQAFSFPLCQHA
jgi:hypothetical protein